MKKFVLLVVCVLCVMFCGGKNNAVYADEDRYWCRVWHDKERIYLDNVGQQGELYYFECSIYNDSGKSQTVTLSSSDPDTVSVLEETNHYEAPYGKPLGNHKFACRIFRVGVCTLTLTIGEKTTKVIWHIMDSSTKIKNISQTGFNTMQITWESSKGYAGFYILRAKPEEGEENVKNPELEPEEIIATIKNGNKRTIQLENKDYYNTYFYSVQGYIQDGESVFENLGEELVGFKMDRRFLSSILSVKKAGNSSLKISWKRQTQAVGYEIYRTEKDGGGYRRIKKIKGNRVGSYTDKVKRGITYYYRLKIVYPDNQYEYSDTVSKMLPKSVSVLKKSQSVVDNLPCSEQYSYYHANCENASYYEAEGKFHTVVPGKNCFYVYTFDSSLKRAGQKKIHVKYQRWGGFCQGPDGSFYIAVGFDNHKESRKKTVIKVIKYDKNWKKGKTCSIKGGVSHRPLLVIHPGIYEPFHAGNCQMDVWGNTLYLHTCKLMFADEGGINHQLNSSFAINTNTMKGNVTGDVFVSHSFNQYVRFQNGDLYLLDHGDAGPRAIQLCMIKSYGEAYQCKKVKELFRFKENPGGGYSYNFTGCCVGGMEVGSHNVLICGIAQPHGYKIKGVSGMKKEGFGSQEKGYTKNVFVIVTDKETGKHKIKWLTTHNPKSRKVEVGQTRMIKLDDNRFAVMYTETRKNKRKLHYVVLDENGKKIYAKVYADIPFHNGTQPIVYRGRVVWLDKFGWDERGTNSEGMKIPKIYGIPALSK